MDIKQLDLSPPELRQLHLSKPLKERIRESLSACPPELRVGVSVLYTDMGDALAEIERLEGEVIQERGRRAADRQEYDAVTRALRQQLDAYTDRMIAAGLMA